jgi:ketosteroid isomerase-like protein
MSTLLPADSAAVSATQAAFVDAWLRDDTTGVLAQLDTSVVLVPPGSTPVTGHDAVRAYWWPKDGSRTRITSFGWSASEIAGSGDIAYMRGISSLGWTYAKDSAEQRMTARSHALIIMRRSAPGRWVIARQMWSPAPN